MSIFGSGGPPPEPADDGGPASPTSDPTSSSQSAGADTAPSATPSPSPDPAPAPAPSSRRAVVVVANPDGDVCEVLGRVVEAAGHEALRVTDPTTIAGTVADRSAEVVVLDAGSATLDLLRELRNGGTSGAEVRAVVVGTGPASARLAWQAGADAVLTRPFAATEVGQAIDRTLARSGDDRAAERRTQVAALGA